MCFVDVANPTYSTGVGLVIKGFEEYESEDLFNHRTDKREAVIIDEKKDKIEKPLKNKSGLFKGIGSYLSDFLKDGEQFDDFEK